MACRPSRLTFRAPCRRRKLKRHVEEEFSREFSTATVLKRHGRGGSRLRQTLENLKQASDEKARERNQRVGETSAASNKTRPVTRPVRPVPSPRAHNAHYKEAARCRPPRPQKVSHLLSSSAVPNRAIYSQTSPTFSSMIAASTYRSSAHVEVRGWRRETSAAD